MATLKSKLHILAITTFILLVQVATIVAQEEEAVEAAESSSDGSGTLVLIIGLAAVVAVGFFASVRENETTSESE